MAFKIKKKQKFNQCDQLFFTGQNHHLQGDLQQAELFYNEALKINPRHSKSLQMLGVIRLRFGKFREAIELIKESISIDPTCAEAYNNLGNVFEELNQLEEAKTHYETALLRDSKLVNAHYNLGNLSKNLGQFDKAKDYYKTALAINPEYVHASNALGNLLVVEGKIDEGLFYFRYTLKRDPNYVIAYDNLLLALNYHAKLTPEEIYQEHVEFDKKHTNSKKVYITPFTNSLDLNRQLRIGYVSADFRSHSVFYFIEPILRNHDKNKFEIFCYSNSYIIDSDTKYLQDSIFNWRDIYGMDDGKFEDLIKADKIDILIDLNGHTADNKLSVFARKPAPIQVTWLGYPNTTGLDTIDYRIVDSFTDPEGLTDPFYAEKLIRMPECFSCYSPIVDSPNVNELPALKNGYITFGSFNNFAKVTLDVISVWVKILKSVPNSKLILKNNILSGIKLQNYIKGLFETEGISSDRIDLIGHTTLQKEHLQYYNKIDIGLDPFPYNGATTSCDALWMGVPIITLEGNTHVSRVGVSQLTNLGLTEFIAKDKEDYINIAKNWSNKLDVLNNIRLGLREWMLKSPLMQGERFTKNLENVYRDMWCKYVEDHSKAVFETVNRLHIGGVEKKEGWKILNALSGKDVDYVCNANNLSQFKDNSIIEIYASHVVEHLDYVDELFLTLKEWHRVLKDGGKLYVSVPDMEVLTKLYLDKERLNFDERFMVMRILFGGHTTKYDFHVVGLDEESLSAYLNEAGFVNIKRVDNFNIFNDLSSSKYHGISISLNITAEKENESD